MGGFVRNAQGTLGALNAVSAFITMKKGGIITLSGTWVGTIALQRRGTDGITVPVTDNTGTVITFTKNGTYSVNPYLLIGDYNLIMSLYTSGTATFLIEGK